MNRVSVFDVPEALRINEVRWASARPVLEKARLRFHLETTADVGCGVGHFSKFLGEAGFQVTGIDGREENVQEAKRRLPNVRFCQADVQSESIKQLGAFDLVFSTGLLYHLENPLLAIRHLHALTGKVLLLESMCFPDTKPWMLLREEPREDNQSLTEVAFYPSEGCIVKMLYRAGFPAVYRLAAQPDHDDFQETAAHARRRVILLASREALDFPELIPLAEPSEEADPWGKIPEAAGNPVERAKRFLRYSGEHKTMAMAVRWHKWLPRVPYPFRLKYGVWWLDEGSQLDELLLWQGGFLQEENQLAFLKRFLRPGMTVLDIGAHHGLYTLLASKLVGRKGRVIAFEPSPRERKRLRRHISLNLRGNVTVERYAVGSVRSEAQLFVMEGHSANGCNSLRPPAVEGATNTLTVEVLPLDDYLDQHQVNRVDLMKLDVEGAELDALKGAVRLLERKPRPVILAEVEDIRTRAWDYRARAILDFLVEKQFTWFEAHKDGTLTELDLNRSSFEGNFVACPKEQINQIQLLLAEAQE